MPCESFLSIAVEDWFSILDSPYVPKTDLWDGLEVPIKANVKKILAAFRINNSLCSSLADLCYSPKWKVQRCGIDTNQINVEQKPFSVFR